MIPLLWNPLGPEGLWSNPNEVHLTIVAVAVAILLAYLDWNRRRKLVVAGVAVAVFAGLLPRFSTYKPWYFVVPLALVWLVYLAVERLLRG